MGADVVIHGRRAESIDRTCKYLSRCVVVSLMVMALASGIREQRGDIHATDFDPFTNGFRE